MTVNGAAYAVTVEPGGAVSEVNPAAPAPMAPTAPKPSSGRDVSAPLAGSIFRVQVSVGDRVESGQVLVVMEAMKMETEVRAPVAGQVTAIMVKEGDAVHAGDPLLKLA